MLILPTKKSLMHGTTLLLSLVSILLPIGAQQVPVKPATVQNLLNQAGQTKSPSGTSKSPVKPAATENEPPTLTTVANPVPVPANPNPKSPASPKPAVKTVAPAAKPAALSVTIPRRDPFAPLLTNGRGEAMPENLPPGKAGLLINTLRIDGIVNGPSGMIAIVSNPQQRVYFLRDSDRLYDGQVQHITMEGISFHQSGRDPFGNPVEREITKRLYLTPGEQR